MFETTDGCVVAYFSTGRSLYYCVPQKVCLDCKFRFPLDFNYCPFCGNRLSGVFATDALGFREWKE